MGPLSAAAWWTFAWFAVVILDGRLFYPGSSFTAYIGGAPYWMPLLVFGGAAMVVRLSSRIASWRSA